MVSTAPCDTRPGMPLSARHTVSGHGRWSGDYARPLVAVRGAHHHAADSTAIGSCHTVDCFRSREGTFLLRPLLRPGRDVPASGRQRGPVLRVVAGGS
jgi:hypothetical protein